MEKYILNIGKVKAKGIATVVAIAVLGIPKDEVGTVISRDYDCKRLKIHFTKEKLITDMGFGILDNCFDEVN